MQTKEKIVEPKIFRSTEAIDKVLSFIGLTREGLSAYKEYSYADGGYLRLRLSGHGLFLQNWYYANKENRVANPSFPKLNIGQNLAITFAPNEDECKEMNVEFPMKIKNVTKAKTEMGNNVKPQFSVRHIAYYSWKLSENEINPIGTSLKNCIENGSLYIEPLGDANKYVEWIDTSNLAPKKITKESKTYKNMKRTITESQLRDMIIESVKKCISELNGYHSTPNTDKNAWRGQKIGDGGIDLPKPSETPKRVANQKKINESQLQNIVSEAVRKTLSEMETNEAYQQYTPNPRQTSLLLTVTQSSNWGGYGNNIAQYHPKTVEEAMNYLSKNGYDTYVLYGTTVTPGIGSGSNIISWGSKGNQLPPSLERLSGYEKQEAMKKRKEI